MTTPTLTSVLRAAKARLTPHTWAKTSPFRRGHECANTALIFATVIAYGRPMCEVHTVTPADAERTLRDAMNLLAEVITGTRSSTLVPLWNDKPERTLQDIHDAYDAAIAIADAQEQADERSTNAGSDTPARIESPRDLVCQ